MSLSRASTPALVGLACLALAAYAVAERSLTPVHAEAYRMKLEAVRLMQRAEAAIAAAKRERGVAVDPRNDPSGSGLVGPEFTLITTDRGAQGAKSLAAHPNFAAAVTQMMLQAGVRGGDLVAVGMTGSLPGMNLAVLAACRAIGATPILITSAGSSMFGATDPVVADRHSDSPIRILDTNVDDAGFRMADDVGNGLLEGEEHIVPQLGRDKHDGQLGRCVQPVA